MTTDHEGSRTVRPNWKQLIGRLAELQDRAGAPSLPGSTLAQDKGMRARVRKGINVQTESYAYADVLPYAVYPNGLAMKDTHQSRLLKAAAIIAQHKNLRHHAGITLGACFTALSRALASDSGQPFAVNPVKPDAVASRIASLPQLGDTAAVETIHRTLSLGDDRPLRIDFFKLTETFLYWDTSVQTNRNNSGNKVLRDYFNAALFTPQEEGSGEPESSSAPQSYANELKGDLS